MAASLTPFFLWAAEPLSLNDCFESSLKRSEVLAGQQELVVQAEENYHKARGRMLPDINGSYSYFRRDAPGTDGSGTVSSSEERTLKITGDQPLFEGFKYIAALDAAKASVTARQQAREWAGMQLYKDVAQAFYECLAMEKDMRVLDKEVGLLQKRIAELQARLEIGRSRNTEVLTEKAAAAILRAQREQIVGQLDVARDVLAFLTGLDPDATLDDTDAVPSDIGTLESYQSRIRARPDVIAAEKNVDAFASGVTEAKGEHLPSVDLVGNYYVQRPDRQRNGDWDVELAVALPIFSGGIISSDVKIAASQKQQAEIQLGLVQWLALEEIRSLHHSLKADLAQLAALQEAFNLSEENYNANVKDYEFGLVTNLDVLQALKAYQDTERSLEKIRYQAKIDYNQLEAAAANRLTLMEGPKTP